MKTLSIPSASTCNGKKKSEKIRKIGYRILNDNEIPHYEVNNTISNCKAVTRARDFAAKMQIKPTAIITVIGKRKSDKFFWSKSGLYSLQHVAANYAGFPELAKFVAKYKTLISKK